jgi:hypothetical protein
MKNILKLLSLLAVIGIFTLFLSGCYTQLKTTREAYSDDNKYTTEEQNEGETYNDENEEYSESSECCEDYRPRVGFVYYYPAYYWPSVAFTIAYTDPWFYDYYWAYDPWYYYSPYRWSYYYWYPPYYYSPYYGYYYSYDWGNVNRSRRYDGAIRGGVTRGGTDYIEQTSSTPTRFDLPGGSSVGRGVSNKNTDRSSASVRENSRRVQDQRSNIRNEGKSSVRTTNPNVRGSGSRDVNRRSDTRNRDTQPKSRPPEIRNSAPPSNSTPRREEHSNTPSYTPPPRSSSPPPSSSGGSSRSGGDSRGGGNNGSRRP